MKCVSAALACAFIYASINAAAASGVQPASTPETLLAEKKPLAIYNSTCGYCHDHAGVAPKIQSRHLPAILTITLVRNGVGAMPAFRDTEISDAELHALAEWLSSGS